MKKCEECDDKKVKWECPNCDYTVCDECYELYSLYYEGCPACAPYLEKIKK